MSGAGAALSEEERAALPEADHPDWIDPMLATLTDERFSDPGWIYERKLDGERALAFRKGDKVRLLSRNRSELGPTYPELVEALARQDCGDFVADGEIVAFQGGVTSFSRLQQRMGLTDPDEARASGVAVFLYVFDLLHLEGRDLREAPLRRRKALLRRALGFDDPLRFTQHRNETGEAYYEAACDKGWEGVIAKRADAPYRGARSRDWLKFKCAMGQEFVIGGFTEPRGERIGFGALLLGYHEDGGNGGENGGGALRYAGKVGTGFDDALLHDLHDRLEKLARDSSPFAGEDAPDDASGEGPTWVEPELVAQIGFTEWTNAGKLRHPRFLGLRRDKPPGEVVRERPGAR